ncbi:hypothetical protein QJS10_CPB17g01229 [Acorus calamus]|uniref:Uncharacterized protein n=1 Tax=Acorus calamus TaxID=4465 RepID=A0AAV9CU18_ACOCL|nr:hypothetical protein QJS10_CPB17g01229 [Acorus calamus]
MERLLVLEATDQLDQLRNKRAQETIAMENVAALNMYGTENCSGTLLGQCLDPENRRWARPGASGNHS